MGIGRGFTLIGTSAGCVGAVAALMGLGVQQGSKKDAPPEFRAVDQGVGDRTGLSASYRDMGVDLRAPMNFDKVYRVDARSRLLQGMKGFEGGAAWLPLCCGVVHAQPAIDRTTNVLESQCFT